MQLKGPKGTINVPDRFVRQLVRGILPSLLLHCARKGTFKPEHLADPKTFISEVYRKGKLGLEIAKAKVMHGPPGSFSKHSREAWRRREKAIALVLLATELEQVTNMYTRHFLEIRGLDEKTATEAIKRSSLDAKHGWLLLAITGHALPPVLVKRVGKIMEIRNSIVHFKAEDCPIGEKEATMDKIDHAIKVLGRLNPETICGRLEYEFQQITRKIDPHFDLVLVAMGKLHEWGWWNSAKKQGKR